MTASKKQYSLNTKQIHTLKLIYKFRAVTASRLASYRGISRISTYNSLKVLESSGYIKSYFDKSFRLQGKAAYYYLTIQSLPALKEQGLTPAELKFIYSKTTSPLTIAQYLDVFAIFLTLRRNYPFSFQIFAKSELTKFKYFPKEKPDLYLNRLTHAEDTINEYLLYAYTNTAFFIIKKRIDSYVEHYDSGEWEAETDTRYPALLIVCHDSKIEWQVRLYATSKLDGRGIDDLQIYTTTHNALLADTKVIWGNLSEPEKLVEL